MVKIKRSHGENAQLPKFFTKQEKMTKNKALKILPETSRHTIKTKATNSIPIQYIKIQPLGFKHLQTTLPQDGINRFSA